MLVTNLKLSGPVECLFIHPPPPRPPAVGGEGERLRSGGRVHGGPPLHQQDEVGSEVSGEPQQAAGERAGRRPPQDPGQREGAGFLSAAHLPGNKHLGNSGCLMGGLMGSDPWFSDLWKA